jgi:hypothetical protein
MELGRRSVIDLLHRNSLSLSLYLTYLEVSPFNAPVPLFCSTTLSFSAFLSFNLNITSLHYVPHNYIHHEVMPGRCRRCHFPLSPIRNFCKCAWNDRLLSRGGGWTHLQTRRARWASLGHAQRTSTSEHAQHHLHDKSLPGIDTVGGS